MVMVFDFLKVTFPSNSQEESIAILCKALLNAGSQRVWPWPATTLPGNRESESSVSLRCTGTESVWWRS